AHKYAYTQDSLTKTLKKVGFKITSFVQEETNHVVTATKENLSIKPLSIAIIQQTPDIGGAEIYMHSLVQEFLKKGNKIYLSTNSDRYIELYKGLDVKVDKITYLIDIIGNWKGLVKALLFLPFSSYAYWQLLSKYQKEKVDVILMSNFGEKMLVTALSVFFKIPVVWIEYSSVQMFLKNNLYFPKIIYLLLNGIPKFVILPSKYTYNSLIIDAHVSLGKLSIVPCGTLVAKKNSKSKISEISDRNLVIGNISRLTREKGQQLIIQAAPLIIKKIPSAFFVLVGEGPDKKYFQNLIDEKKLNKYFFLPGFVEDRQQYLSQMDIFVFPTIWDLEGFGVVTIEAMMQGIPVVGSNMGPVPEVIDDMQTGLLFRKGDSQDLAKKVITLAQNPSLRTRLGLAGKKKAEEKYNIVTVSQQILDILADATL
ncbi:MAG TPA: glycosyltransferase family 4 protein, partial [Patescibacteria group bacterium]|nr:glycosyltransferase family 4 protein [Patescibacteria group bacterium]